MKIVLFLPAYGVGAQLGGVGVRACELAEALAPSCDVSIVARRGPGRIATSVDVIDVTDEAARARALDAAAAVVFYDLPDTAELLRLHRRGTLIVTENAPPIEHLEYHAIRAAVDPDAAYRDLVARYEFQLLVSDHFLVQSHAAMVSLVAALCHVGRLSRANYDRSPSLDHLCSMLPLGFSRVADERAAASSPALPPVDFVWSGGLWDFYDPAALVAAAGELARKGRPITLRFLYPPPTDQVLRVGRELQAALVSLGPDAGIELLAQPPDHLDRDGALLSARAAVCIARPGIENLTCVRLRLRDTMLYRLPLVVDGFGATAETVRALDIGIVVDPRQPRELAAVLEALAYDEGLRRRYVARLDDVRRDYVMDDCVGPLIRLIEEGRHAPDVGTVAHDRLVAARLEQNPRLAEPPDYPW